MNDYTPPDWYMTPAEYASTVASVAAATAADMGLTGKCHPEDLAVHYETTARTVGITLAIVHGRAK